jgi:penicillin-binding protein 2
MGHGVDTRPNGWFVGVIPRRDPEFVVCVLWEHGDWGSNAARLAAQVATVYVNKQRRLENNVLQQAGAPKPAPQPASPLVEMGAVWSESRPAGRSGSAHQDAELHGGHFFIDPNPPTASPKALASAAPTLLPAWLSQTLLRFKEEAPQESGPRESMF